MAQSSNQIYPEVKFSEHTPLVFMIPEYERRYLRREEKELWSFGESSRHIALPMLAYRILIPLPSDPELNLFQSTVLKMMQIKNYANQELADKLCLHTTLIELIIQQLTEKGLLQNRQLTENAKKYLVRNDYELKYKTGYVLYDILSQSFLDDFADDSFYKVYDYERRGNYCCFNASKSVSEDQKTADIRALLIENNRIKIIPPALPHEKSMRICRTVIQRLWNDENLSDEFSTSDDENPPPRFDLSNYSIRIILNPEPVYVVTFIRSRNITDWNVFSPFMTEESHKLTRTLHECFRQDRLPKNFQQLLDFLHRQKGQAENEKGYDSQKEQREKIRNRVKSAIVPYLKKDENAEQLTLSLANAVEAWSKLQTDSVGRKTDYTQKLSQYVLGCYEAMEQGLLLCKLRSLKRIRETMPEFNCASCLTKGTESNQVLLCASAENLGFVKGTRINWKSLFSKVTYGSVSEQNSEPKLEYLLASCLLLAKQDAKHPFLQVEQHQNRREFLENMKLLKNYRDPFSHEFKISFSFEDTHKFMQEVLEYIAWLLDFPEKEISLEKLTGQTPEDSQSMRKADEKSYNQCLYEIEKQQIDISAKNGLIQYLADSLHALHMGNQRDFVKSGALFLENYIRCFKSEFDAGLIEQFEFENQMNDPDVMVIQLCQQLKCLPENSEELTAFFSNANVLKYQRNPVCSKLLFDALLCAEHHQDNHFAHFVYGRPEFISDVCYLHLLRGHSGAKVNEKFSEKQKKKAEEMLNRFYEYIRWIQKSY